LKLQLSNAVFCHFLFNIDASLTVFIDFIPTATLLGHFDCGFLVCICLCLGYPHQPSLE